MVYIVNAHECYDSTGSLARVRNRLFTAITRSKAWVRVCGVGSEMERLIEEYEAVKAADYELRFRYPTERELAELQIVHRDMSPAEEKAIQKQRQFLSGLVADLEAGRVFPEDLDEDLLTKLREILGGNGT